VAFYSRSDMFARPPRGLNLVEIAIMHFVTTILLHINRRSTSITVRPDNRYPSLWRVHSAGWVSDMLNLARAKDAAITWARPRGLGGKESVRWEVREMAVAAPPIAPNAAPDQFPAEVAE